MVDSKTNPQKKERDHETRKESSNFNHGGDFSIGDDRVVGIHERVGGR